MYDFHRLRVWQRAHGVPLAVYRATAGFPGPERFGLTSQMRRAAVSVASNIAEACGRTTGADRRRFFGFAFASASELEYQVMLSGELGFLGTSEITELSSAVVETKRMLAALIKRTSSARRSSDI